jgi:transposase-like protein
MSGTALRCPFCDSSDVEKVSAWGGQLMTSAMRCRTCHSHFEAVRDDFASEQEAGEAHA